MKSEDRYIAIECDPGYGPIFGSGRDIYIRDIGIHDICIRDNCNKNGGWTCYGNSDSSYECNNSLKQSLFVNTAGPNEKNNFSVLDYEVFSIENYKDYICDTCKHPDIIWEYIETKDISEESLNQFDDDIELLNDLDAIHCYDSIRFKVSHYYLKNPSELLVNTQLVNQQYDAKLREWIGNDYQWRLIYRASEHEYTASSFHECCNDKGPTLIVIKSSGGWIFGGYTTQSWSGDGIYNKYDIFNNQ